MNEPKLRFKTDDGSRFPDLKKISLESLMTFKNGINADGSKFGHGVKCISVMDILNNAYITHDIIKGAVNIDEKTLSNFSVEYGDVLFQRSSENVQDAGRANVYIDKDKIATYSGFVIRGKKISEYEPVFMNNLLNTFTVRKQIMSKAQGAQHINIGQEILSSIAVKIPCLPEQQKIASLFTELDNLIQSAQKELDGYRELKQGMLQKMFPKKGEKVPEIRFPEFTGDWEQRKLEDIVGIYDGVHQTPNYQNSGVMFLSVENIATLKSSKFISEEDFKRDYKVFPQENDILMTRIGDVGTTNVVTDNGLKAYYVSLALLKYKSTDPYFLSNAIQSDYVQKELANRTLKTAIPMKINKDEIGKVSVMLPLSATEQQQIGTYFRNLDDLITLHQRELDGYKELKKGLLQQMFC